MSDLAYIKWNSSAYHRNSKGNLITKADGTTYTLDDWLALTNEERDLLDINEQFGE